MEELNKVRKHFIKMRMNDEELGLLKKLFDSSIEKSLSNYLRKVCLQKPVTIRYRNASADDLRKSLIDLKKEMNSIGNNWNQAVKKLHVLEKIPEFRFWLNHYQSLQLEVLHKINDVKFQLQQVYTKWSQE